MALDIPLGEIIRLLLGAPQQGPQSFQPDPMQEYPGQNEPPPEPPQPGLSSPPPWYQQEQQEPASLSSYADNIAQSGTTDPYYTRAQAKEDAWRNALLTFGAPRKRETTSSSFIGELNRNFSPAAQAYQGTMQGREKERADYDFKSRKQEELYNYREGQLGAREAALQNRLDIANLNDRRSREQFGGRQDYLYDKLGLERDRLDALVKLKAEAIKKQLVNSGRDPTKLTRKDIENFKIAFRRQKASELGIARGAEYRLPEDQDRLMRELDRLTNDYGTKLERELLIQGDGTAPAPTTTQPGQPQIIEKMVDGVLRRGYYENGKLYLLP